MRTIVVDDEIWDMKLFHEMGMKIGELEIVEIFQNPNEALEFVQKAEIELAILDIEMPEINGFILGEKLEQIKPEMLIIYATGFAKWTINKMELRGKPLVMKPYNATEIEFAVEHAKRIAAGKKGLLVAETFGGFNVYSAGRLIEFDNPKAKELLALCINNYGKCVTVQEAGDKLWNNLSVIQQQKMYRQTVLELHRILQREKVYTFFYFSESSCTVNPDLIHCDFYNYISGQVAGRTALVEDYLPEYEWAEDMMLRLIKAQVNEKVSI